MNTDEKKQVYDRREVPLDDKLRKLDLSKMNLIPPTVGICDPPLRVYPLNNEWAKIVIGLVSWLAEIAPWKDAEDESYVGIQEIETFMIGCDPCEVLTGCIQGIIDIPPGDRTDSQQDLIDAITKITTQPGNPSNPYILEDNPVFVDSPGACDPDNLFAAVTGLVDLAHTAIVDVLQKIDVYTNVIELIGKILSAIPGLNQLPLDEIADLAENFFDNLLSNYLASYTEPLRTQYRCDLFCDAVTDCQFDFEDAFIYFSEKALLDWNITELVEVVNFFATGTFTGELLVHAAHAFFFHCLAHGMAWSSYSVDFLTNHVRSKFNDSDADWSILCPCSSPWRAKFDFTVSDCGYTATYGQYLPGVGWATTLNTSANPDDQRIYADLAGIGESVDLIRTDINVSSYTPGGWEGSSGLWALVGGGQFGVPHATRAEIQSTGAALYSKDRDYTTSEPCRVDARSARIDGGGGDVVVSYYEIWGNGTAPQVIIDNATEFEYL